MDLLTRKERETLIDEPAGPCASVFLPTHRAGIHDEPEAGDGDLLDFAAVRTILDGGAAYVTDPEEMPDEAELACVFRY